ncbi:MAG TPA: hypothetical protein VIV11_21715, partial [Kofleriaceae bacterium]
LSTGALVLKPWAVSLSPSALLVAMLGIVIIQMLANTFVFAAQQRLQTRAQEQLHVQKWQLEQLVPSSGSPS